MELIRQNMRILLLTFYYPPDLSAGSFRARALEEALVKEAGRDLHIDVISTMPNRYHSMKWAADANEEHGNVTIRRIAIPEHKSGMADQARAFGSFAFKVRRLAQNAKWDGVVATSSRLMTAALGARIARSKKIPLYLDIRDLFTDTMSDLLQGKALRSVLPAFSALEKWTLRSANRVNIVSPGFLPHVSRFLGEEKIRTFTNGIDDDFLNLDFSSERNDPVVIVYAGNMGEGQGLHRVVPEAACMLGSRARFRLIGDGGRRKQLEDAIEKAGIDNVELLDPVPRQQLYAHYRDADYLLLHLNDHAAFHKVLPSKIFEYAASGKPVLAGVSGCAAEFLQTEVQGSAVFAPCDPQGLVDAFEHLEGQKGFDREMFKEKFARRLIMRDMARDILKVMGQQRRRHG
ncbi:MAG: glycosyltransferase family 4 protein [Desulfobacterales bacterium]